MDVGTISPPFQFRMDDGTQALRILYYKNKILPHQGSLKDDYQRFRTYALNKKQAEALNNWFDRTKSEIYLTIDDEYNRLYLQPNFFNLYISKLNFFTCSGNSLNHLFSDLLS